MHVAVLETYNILLVSVIVQQLNALRAQDHFQI